MERKEYQDRQEAPLVNPPVTYGDYEAKKVQVDTEEDRLLSDEAYYVCGC